MNNSLKNKIIDTIKKNRPESVNEICSNLKDEQNKIIRQLDKQKHQHIREVLIQEYNEIESLGKSLYRFKQLSESGLYKDAYNEAQNIAELLSELSGTTEYRWVTEPNACERCQRLNNSVYYSTEDIPERPHPNCKCKIKIDRYSYSSAFTLSAQVYENNTNNFEEEAKKMQKEVEQLESKTQKYLDDIEKQEKLLADLENKVDINLLSSNDKRTYNELKRNILVTNSYFKQSVNGLKKFKNICSNLNTIKTKYPLDNKSPKLKELQYDIVIYYNKSNNLLNIAIKLLANIYGTYHSNKYNMPEALNLYKIASPDYNYNKDYINSNGYMYKNINSFPHKKIQNDIHKRIKDEMNLADCKVIFLRSDSSLAQKIVKSNTFHRFLDENYIELIKNKKLPDTEITFESDDADLYSSIHGGWFKNIHLDSKYNLRIRAEDFYNFNKRFTSAKAILGRYLQDVGKLIPYYLIIDLNIEASEWLK